MQNALQKAIRETVKPLKLPLHKVWDGSECIHTGQTYHKGQTYNSKSPKDKGLHFIKTSNSHQNVVGSEERIILGLNDIVEVIQK